MQTHGATLADDYFWLRNKGTPEVEDYLKAELAYAQQDQMITAVNAEYAAISDLGVKQALFFVLIDARMPSALVEVSFISNAEEERLLATPAYRKKLASSIVR